MKQLKYITTKSYTISTIKIPDTELYETMIFDVDGNEIYTKVYDTKLKAVEWHNRLCKINN